MYSLTFRKLWVSIQSIILSICASGSSSGLPGNLGLKYDQFIAMGTGCGVQVVLLAAMVTVVVGIVGVVLHYLVQKAVVVLLPDPLSSFPSLIRNHTSLHLCECLLFLLCS